MKSVRGKMAVLCPETDGLQAKHRIKRVLKGKTHQERIEEMRSILGNEIQFDKICFTKLLSRIISLVYDFEGFSSSEVYQILKNEYFKNFR